jgi:hypothetical protein
MKISAFFLIAGSASAFTPAAPKASVSVLRLAESLTEPEEPFVAPLPTMSASLPFMSRPPALDGSLAGDVGFDPLGFSKSKEDLMNYREAEVKHARLAMLVSLSSLHFAVSFIISKNIFSHSLFHSFSLGCCWMASF